MKVLTTPRSYGKADPAVFGMLEGAGLEVIRNTTGGILGKADMKRLLADCEGVIVGWTPWTPRSSPPPPGSRPSPSTAWAWTT